MVVERASDGSWSVEQPAAGGSLVLRFWGPTSTSAFGEFLAGLTARMPEANATLVFDLRKLEGYNPETKEQMKAWLLAHKLAIRELIVVVPKSETMVRMVAAAVGLAAGIKITVRDEPVEADLCTNAANA
jgi:hypothetical protein